MKLKLQEIDENFKQNLSNICKWNAIIKIIQS